MEKNDLNPVPTINLKAEERIAWLCALGLMTIIAGVSAWRLAKVEAPPPPSVPPGVLARLDALEAGAAAQAKLRCLNVTTDRMDLAIFPVENLGKKKVTP